MTAALEVASTYAMARVPECARWACTVRLFSSAILCFLAEVFQAFEHCARHERKGHGRIVENLGEAPALFRRNKLSPRHRLRVSAPRQPAPMHRLGTNPHAVVVAFQRKLFVAAPRQQLRVHAELLRPVPRYASADGEDPHLL